MPKAKGKATADAETEFAPAPPPAQWVYEQRTLGPLERLLLLAVADHADDDEWFRGCLEELSSWTGLDPMAVEHVRLELINRGLLAYSDEPEDSPPERDCTSRWCSPESRDEHPQRIRVAELPTAAAETEPDLANPDREAEGEHIDPNSPEGYVDGTVDVVTARLDQVQNGPALDAIAAAETAGKNRSGVHEAIERRRADLPEQPGVTEGEPPGDKEPDSATGEGSEPEE